MMEGASWLSLFSKMFAAPWFLSENTQGYYWNRAGRVTVFFGPNTIVSVQNTQSGSSQSTTS
jgi:hypothetical protein